MAKYRVTINTDGFTLFPCSKKNWEPGTVNDFIHAINGWKSTENSLQEVRWRIELLFHHAHYHCGNPKWEQWFAKKKNKITYRDRLCGIDRTDDISVPGFAQGYVDIDELLSELEENGAVKIPFSKGYDIRQANSKHFKKCFMEIRKEVPERNSANQIAPAEKGIYSMGLCGYEIWSDPNDSDRMMARFIGDSKENKARSYTIQTTTAGRAFIRPYGMRVYLDQVLRA